MLLQGEYGIKIVHIVKGKRLMIQTEAMDFPPFSYVLVSFNFDRHLGA